MYSVISGDTFETIARKVYGKATESGSISKANPGASEPLTAGTVLFIPALASVPSGSNVNGVDGGADEVSLLIDGARFRYWTELRITRAIDSMDSISLSAPFNPDDTTFRDAFRPFSFTPLQVAVGGSALFTGTMVSVVPNMNADSKTVSVDGYATPGVLGDCTPPASAYPTEYNGQELLAIAEDLAAPFGVSVTADAETGSTFERVACDVGTKVLDFLTKLATQRALVLGSTTDGELELRQSTSGGSPVAVLEQGVSPVMAVTPSFSPQAYFSHITGIEPVVVGLSGSQHTYSNEQLESVLRPLTFTASDTLDADLPAAVTAKAARMFGNMVSYSVAVATWRDPSGDMWAPNTTVKLEAPGAMIYEPYEFLIRAVEFTVTATERTAVLTLVMLGAFSGEIPESLPWDY